MVKKLISMVILAAIVLTCFSTAFISSSAVDASSNSTSGTVLNLDLTKLKFTEDNLYKNVITILYSETKLTVEEFKATLGIPQGYTVKFFKTDEMTDFTLPAKDISSLQVFNSSNEKIEELLVNEETYNPVVIIPASPSKKKVFYNFDYFSEDMIANVFGKDFGPPDIKRPSTWVNGNEETGEDWNPGNIGWAYWGNGIKSGYELSGAPEKGLNGTTAGKWKYVNKKYSTTWCDITLWTWQNDPSVTDWTGTQEIWFHIDNTEIKTVNRIDLDKVDTGHKELMSFYLLLMEDESTDAAGAIAQETWVNDMDKPWFYRADGTRAWSTVVNKGREGIPENFKGWIRLPLSSLTTSWGVVDKTIEFNLDKAHNYKHLVRGFTFGISVMNGNTGKSVYIDDFTLYGDNIPNGTAVEAEPAIMISDSNIALNGNTVEVSKDTMTLSQLTTALNLLDGTNIKYFDKSGTEITDTTKLVSEAASFKIYNSSSAVLATYNLKITIKDTSSNSGNDNNNNNPQTGDGMVAILFLALATGATVVVASRKKK
jgi:hypothetical protein